MHSENGFLRQIIELGDRSCENNKKLQLGGGFNKQNFVNIVTITYLETKVQGEPQSQIIASKFQIF